MTWNFEKLKCSSLMFLSNDRKCRNTDLKQFIRYKTWFIYCKIFSLCERYCVINTKSTKTRMKFNAWNYLFINSEIITNIICRIIAFCSISIHCLTSKNWLNLFKSMKAITLWNLAFNWFKFEISCFVEFVYVRFLEIDIFAFNKSLIQMITCMIMSFNNWWRTFNIMISCMFIISCFHAKFDISCTQSSFVLLTCSFFCCCIWCWVHS
jgi:hypothetical protein